MLKRNHARRIALRRKTAGLRGQISLHLLVMLLCATTMLSAQDEPHLRVDVKRVNLFVNVTDARAAAAPFTVHHKSGYYAAEDDSRERHDRNATPCSAPKLALPLQ